MAVQSRDRKPRKGEVKRKEYKSHRVLYRLNGARDGSWQTVPVGIAPGHRKQAEALDGWLRDVHGYAMRSDDPRIADFLGQDKPTATADDDDEPAERTVAEIMREWIDTRPGKAEATRVSYRASVLDKLGTLGDLVPSKLTRTHVNRWFTAYEDDGVSSNSLARCEAVLKGSLRRHLAPLVFEDIFADVSYSRDAETDVQPIILTAEQTTALLDAAKGSALWLPLFFICETGARYGEMAGMSAGDIDLAEPAVHLRRQRSQSTKLSDGFNPTKLKSRNSRRDVPISPELAEALTIAASLPHDSAAFSPSYSEAWIYDGFLKAFRRLVVATEGIPDGLRIHDLRHSAAMRWLRAGVPLPVVSRLLGHSSLAITDETYSHWDADDRRAILGAGVMPSS
jgi:integrase